VSLESTPSGVIVTTANSGDGAMRVIEYQMTANSSVIGLETSA
jgi:hypothetical protein